MEHNRKTERSTNLSIAVTSWSLITMMMGAGLYAMVDWFWVGDQHINCVNSGGKPIWEDRPGVFAE